MKKISIALLASATALTLAACAPSTMSAEAAGQKYLEIVCPGNTAMDAYVAAMLGSNLDMIHNSAQALKDEYAAEIEEFSAVKDTWPDGIQENVTVISDANSAVIDALDKVLAAKTLDDVKVKLPAIPGISEAVKNIRSELGLSSDSKESCKSVTE